MRTYNQIRDAAIELQRKALQEGRDPKEYCIDMTQAELSLMFMQPIDSCISFDRDTICGVSVRIIHSREGNADYPVLPG